MPTQEQLADMIGISVDTLQNYKMLADMGRCFSFLNKWYGFEHGAKSFHGNQHIKVSEKVFNSPNNNPSTQKELAKSYGITQQTMNNYMRMADMIPELEDSFRLYDEWE